MTNSQISRSAARSFSPSVWGRHLWMAGSALVVAAAVLAQPAWSEGHGTIIKSHGFNEYGDLKYPADFPYLDYVNPDAPIYGEVSISTSGSFDSMNPFATLSGSPGALSSSIYERIMTATSDEVGSSYCLLCETLEYPQDQAWVQFNLRKGITFSDGSALTAHDIEFTMRKFMAEGTPSWRVGMKALLQSSEVIDDYTIKFTFNPDSQRRGRIGQMGSLLAMSKSWFEKTGAKLDESRMDVSPGTGEYMIGKVDAPHSITYRRNPNYWGEDLPINKGRGNYESIRIEYFADTAAAFLGFQAGEFTLRRENSSLNWATRYDFAALDKGWIVRDTLEDGSLPAATGFVFNLRRDKFSDVRVREALGLMYNFTWTNDNLQYGLFKQRESFWENDRLKATGLPEGKELEFLKTVRDLVDPSIFTEPAVLPHTSGERALDRRNLRRALALMAQAGWVPGDDGLLRNADGQSLDVEFLETRQSFDRILTPYVENLKALGVNVTYNRVDPSQYQARTQSNDFDMMFGFYVNGLVEGTGLLQRFGCEDKDDVFNDAGYCSPAVDALGKIVENADNYGEMAAAVRAIDRIMRAERYIVPVWYLGANWFAYYDMYEYPDTLPEFDVGSSYLDYWWINKDKETALKSAGAFR